MSATPPAVTPPAIFDASVVAARTARARARRARRGPSFLLDRMLDDLADRIADVNRTFGDMLLVAPDGAQAGLRERLPAERLPGRIDARPPDAHLSLGLQGAAYDLAVALVGPGQVDDLPGALIEMRRALRPDGLLVAALFGADTLGELRAALYADDEARRGGLTPRVHPTLDHTQAAQLLGRAGLALPVVDVDRVRVRYHSLSTLVDDLRDLGVTNALAARDRGYLGRGALERISARYPREDGRHPATFEILWLTGWAPHESQQVPLRPGSAKMRLADALGVREEE